MHASALPPRQRCRASRRVSLTLCARYGAIANRYTPFRNCPRIGIQRVAVLAHQVYGTFVVYRHDTDGLILEPNNTIDSGVSRGRDHIAVFRAYPRVFVCSLFTYRFPVVGFLPVHIDKMKMTSIRIAEFPSSAHVRVSSAWWHALKPISRRASAGRGR